MERKEDDFELKLLTYIEQAKKDYEEKGKEQIKFMEEMQVIKDKLDGFIKLLNYHKEETREIKIDDETKFSKIGMRDACDILLKEKGEMNKEQLVKELQAGGFKFTAKKPIRAVHFAMVNNSNVNITEDGTYKWIWNESERIPIMSLPKALKEFFRQRNNEPAAESEILEGIKKVGVRTTSKDLEGSLKIFLGDKQIMEITDTGKYLFNKGILA